MAERDKAELFIARCMYGFGPRKYNKYVTRMYSGKLLVNHLFGGGTLSSAKPRFVNINKDCVLSTLPAGRVDNAVAMDTFRPVASPPPPTIFGRLPVRVHHRLVCPLPPAPSQLYTNKPSTDRRWGGSRVVERAGSSRARVRRTVMRMEKIK